LKTILDDEDKAQQQKTINDSMSENDKALNGRLEAYITCRASRPVPTVISMEQGQIPSRQAHRRADRLVTKGAYSLHIYSYLPFLSFFPQELAGIDNDVKAKLSQYNQTKGALAAAERKRTGNLATKSLVNVVSPSSLIQDSEYLDTHLIAVPNMVVKEFYKSYEELAPMVVPRSANKLAADDEFNLFAVTTFKKHSAEFVHKCREKRWTPREYKYKEGGKEEEAKEAEQLAKDEKKLWGEALRLGRTGYSESAMIWIHVLALRVFVETVLRYGLPLDFVCGIVQVRFSRDASRRTFVILDVGLTYNRRMQRQQRRRRRTSIRRTRTSEAMPSVAITRDASRRTIRQCRRICNKLGTREIRSTRRMCTMSLRLYDSTKAQRAMEVVD
jgi:hypothetical protein